MAYYYYFYKVAFLTFVNLPLFILHHNGMHTVKIVQYMSVYICKEKLEFSCLSKDIWNSRSISKFQDFGILIPRFLGEPWLGSSVMEQYRPSLPYINCEKNYITRVQISSGYRRLFLCS